MTEALTVKYLFAWGQLKGVEEKEQRGADSRLLEQGIRTTRPAGPGVLGTLTRLLWLELG